MSTAATAVAALLSPSRIDYTPPAAHPLVEELPQQEHVHSFAVDISCKCGIMLSEYVKGLKRQRDELADALVTLRDRLLEISSGQEGENAKFNAQEVRLANDALRNAGRLP